MQRFVGNGIDFPGDPVDLAPRVSATAAIDHAIDMATHDKLRLHASIKYGGSYYLSDFGDGIRYKQPDYTRSIFNVTYEVDGGRYSVQAFVENIENKVQRTSFVGASYSGGVYGGVGNHAPGSLPDKFLAFYTTTPRHRDSTGFGSRQSSESNDAMALSWFRGCDYGEGCLHLRASVKS